jgi:hypothetical protein
MPAPILAVCAQEYLDNVGREPFIGLPREEIERLHGVISVHCLDRAQLDSSHLALTAYAAFHHNYAWVIGLDGPSTLGKQVELTAESPTPEFLGDALHALARRALERSDIPRWPCEWRLAGLMNQRGQLSLVYVVRLHQRFAPSSSQLHVRGNNELRLSRDAYDAPSQLIIDHLHAF